MPVQTILTAEQISHTYAIPGGAVHALDRAAAADGGSAPMGAGRERMTAVAWERPARGRTRRTRRDDIFEWVCRDADEIDGPTPSINEIAVRFKLN